MGYGARSQLLGRVNPRTWGPFVRRRMQGIEDASKPTARRAWERAYRVRTAVAARRINSSETTPIRITAPIMTYSSSLGILSSTIML